MFKNLFKPKALDLVSPMTGKVIALASVKDEVFSSKSMGDGFAVELASGNVHAPVDGEVVLVFPTKHAIGLKGDDRNEYLIHIGMDTVNLGGEGFTTHVEVGQKVTKGQLMVEVDHEFFKSKNIDLTSPVIVTNLNGRRVIQLKQDVQVNQGESGIIAIKV